MRNLILFSVFEIKINEIINSILIFFFLFFSELLDRLNHWLHVNPRWGCRVIETVYYDSGSHFNRTESYMKKGRYQYELRGLRYAFDYEQCSLNINDKP